MAIRCEQAYNSGGLWPERVEVSSDGDRVWYEDAVREAESEILSFVENVDIDLPVEAEGWLVPSLKL